MHLPPPQGSRPQHPPQPPHGRWVQPGTRAQLLDSAVDAAGKVVEVALVLYPAQVPGDEYVPARRGRDPNTGALFSSIFPEDPRDSHAPHDFVDAKCTGQFALHPQPRRSRWGTCLRSVSSSFVNTSKSCMPTWSPFTNKPVLVGFLTARGFEAPAKECDSDSSTVAEGAYTAGSAVAREVPRPRMPRVHRNGTFRPQAFASSTHPLHLGESAAAARGEQPPRREGRPSPRATSPSKSIAKPTPQRNRARDRSTPRQSRPFEDPPRAGAENGARTPIRERRARDVLPPHRPLPGRPSTDRDTPVVGTKPIPLMAEPLPRGPRLRPQRIGLQALTAHRVSRASPRSADLVTSSRTRSGAACKYRVARRLPSMSL